LGGNRGEQLCGFAAALANGCFEERQLWGVATLGSGFWKQLLGAALAAWGGSCPEQLAITTLGSGFGEQLCGAALGSSFEEHLCTAALKNRSFGEQL